MILEASPNAPAYDEAEWRRDCIRRDWPGLAAAAVRLLVERRHRDPASIEAGRLTVAEASMREQTMGDVVAIWRAVVRQEDIPPLTVSHTETCADLEGAAATWARIASSRPDDQACADRANQVAALAQYHRAVAPDGTPMIVAVHQFNQQWRSLHASRPASTKAAATPTPAPLQPRRTPSRGPRAPEPQQKGLL